MNFSKTAFKKSTNKFRHFKNHFISSFRKIHLVDKCLLVLMIILLSQSAYILITNGGDIAEANHIDIIIRTASASIFGYFISANFVQSNISKKPLDTADITNPELSKTDVPLDIPASEEKRNFEIGRLQILTATAIATFCLICLLLVRNDAGQGVVSSASTTAIASQFRDFVSGCVGFLIGCPTQKSNIN